MFEQTDPDAVIRSETQHRPGPPLSIPHQLTPCRRPLEPTAGEVVVET